MGCLPLAAEHPVYMALGAKTEDHVRSFINYPNIVLWIDTYRVGVGPGIKVFTDFTDKISVSVELQKLGRGFHVSGAHRAATT